MEQRQDAAGYDYARINSAVKMAPAMAPGVSNTLWAMDDIVALIDAAAPAPKPRGPYKKRELHSS